MNQSTKQSKEWRAEQRRLGRVPKLIWINPLDWPRIQGLIDMLKRKRAKDKSVTEHDYPDQQEGYETDAAGTFKG